VKTRPDEWPGARVIERISDSGHWVNFERSGLSATAEADPVILSEISSVSFAFGYLTGHLNRFGRYELSRER
jgi:hypothetical protein